MAEQFPHDVANFSSPMSAVEPSGCVMSTLTDEPPLTCARLELDVEMADTNSSDDDPSLQLRMPLASTGLESPEK